MATSRRLPPTVLQKRCGIRQMLDNLKAHNEVKSRSRRHLTNVFDLTLHFRVRVHTIGRLNAFLRIVDAQDPFNAGLLRHQYVVKSAATADIQNISR